MALPHNNFVPASEISIRTMNTMRGKICSAIEGLNLPESQEVAAITLIKQFSYDAQEVISQLLDSLDKNDKQFRYNQKVLEIKEFEK
jgi:L-2-hydroxyglutarate oxidase LhgO